MKENSQRRKAVRDADNGEPDIDLLYGLAVDFLNQVEELPDRKAIIMSLQLLTEIAGALTFAGMEREGRVIEQCHRWLSAASRAGSVREDEAFKCFADAFAQIELHLQRSILDPLDDTSHMMSFAELRAGELDKYITELSSGADVTAVKDSPTATAISEERHYVQDADIPPQFKEVFIEESEEIVAELTKLLTNWKQQPEANENLRDIRRHFHTFKGNGRAVGANILGELGWAAQDMLDGVMDGDIAPGPAIQKLLEDVVGALPSLVMSYRKAEGLDLELVRDLTNQCFRVSKDGGADLAGELPLAEEVLATPAGVEKPEVAPETLSH